MLGLLLGLSIRRLQTDRQPIHCSVPERFLCALPVCRRIVGFSPFSRKTHPNDYHGRAREWIVVDDHKGNTGRNNGRQTPEIIAADDTNDGQSARENSNPDDSRSPGFIYPSAMGDIKFPLLGSAYSICVRMVVSFWYISVSPSGSFACARP